MKCVRHEIYSGAGGAARLWMHTHENQPISKVAIAFTMLSSMILQVQLVVWVSRKLGLRDGQRLGRSIMEAHIVSL